MSTYKKLMTFGCAAVLALGLAACGGGGSDTTQAPPPVVEPEPDPTPAELLAAAEKAVSDAEAAVAAATNAAERSAAYSQLAAAEQLLAEARALPDNVLADLRQRLADATDDLDAATTAATNLRNAIDAVNAAEMAAAALDADSDQAAVTAAMGLVTAARTAVDALGADDQARLQGQVDGANSMVMAAQNRLDNAAMVAANTKAAGTKRAAIAAEATQGPGQTPLNDDAGLGGSADDGSAVATYTLAISRDRDGTEIKITDSALAGDDDPKFALAEDLGHGGQMHTRTMKADDDGNVMTEVAIVYTDIEAPKATEFAKVAGQALNADLDTTMDADNDGTADDDLTALWVGADGNTAPVEATLGLVKSAAFTAASGDSVTHTFARFQLDSDATTDGNQTIQAFTSSGTYNGADGTYRCGTVQATADCTVTVDDEGKITAMSVGWVFIPNEGATSDVADADYLHYGAWLKRTADADGAITYNEVETFAGSSVAATGDVSSVTGSATYEGGAAGVYVHSVSNPDGTEASATSGRFTADASLTAYFAQTVDDTTTPVDEAGQIAPALLNSISGTIDNFNLSGHDTGPGWSVSLEKGAITTSDGTFSGTAKGGGADGSYSGTFHGPVGDHDSDAETPDIPHPTSAVGEFNANFSNGSVAGAFGARKQ